MSDNQQPSSETNQATPTNINRNEIGPLTVILPPDIPAPNPPNQRNLGMFRCYGPRRVQIQDMHAEDIPPPELDFSAPPPYETATKLPTYEEVQREKSLHGELPHTPAAAVHRPQTFAFFAIDAEPANPLSEPDSGLLGTSTMFLIAFLVAFVFNWIGFMVLMCFSHTIASRYGALSGFGLSLAKWTIIVKHSTEYASSENSWLWWLIMAFGLLICIRAFIQYLNIKRGWRLLSGSAQERLLFFY